MKLTHKAVWKSEKRRNPLRRYGSRARYKHERLMPPGKLDPRSMRTIRVGSRRRRRLVVGCPAGHYRGGRCTVGMRAQALLTPKRGNPSYPTPERIPLRELELWVQNDEGLYRWWRASRLPMRSFLRQHRSEIAGAVFAAVHRDPRGNPLKWREGVGQWVRPTERGTLYRITEVPHMHGGKRPFVLSMEEQFFDPMVESEERTLSTHRSLGGAKTRAASEQKRRRNITPRVAGRPSFSKPAGWRANPGRLVGQSCTLIKTTGGCVRPNGRAPIYGRKDGSIFIRGFFKNAPRGYVTRVEYMDEPKAKREGLRGKGIPWRHDFSKERPRITKVPGGFLIRGRKPLWGMR